MTKPYYHDSCAAGSQVCREASSPDASDPEDYAWIVNFNNGNVNLNNRDNNAWVRAVRSAPASEYQGEGEDIPLQTLFKAWQKARRKKRPSEDQMQFESQWIDGLLTLQRQLQAGTWQPAPTICFIAKRPKAREIHAPRFKDRIVHHWLVPQLEAIYENVFIADSYSNRCGKGTLAAVQRLWQLTRHVSSGQGGGYFLQLDIHNFFPSIHRPTLYAMLKLRMQREGLPLVTQRVTHALLRHGVARTGVHHRSTPTERAMVPRHKRLESAAPGCGIPIGNLSSQFFANVYLDALDQFVKHHLRAKRYLRYVDDFVLVHQDLGQLQQWQAQITTFLRDRLRLSLKDDIRLQPLADGVDFLGYIVRPTHIVARRRVIAHANEALSTWERDHIKGQAIRATPAELRAVQATWNSYRGHFQHASTQRLQQRFHRRYPWLMAATAKRRFHHQIDHQAREIRFGSATEPYECKS